MNVFKAFADVPYNIWPWILLVGVPMLIFSAKPQHRVVWRLGRIVLAVAAGYVLINLALHTHHALQWKAFEACREQYPVFGENYHPNCEGIVTIADGAGGIFYLILGWIPAAAYAGFWELCWRRKYRRTVSELGAGYKGKGLSNALIVISVPVWLAVVLLGMIGIVR